MFSYTVHLLYLSYVKRTTYVQELSLGDELVKKSKHFRALTYVNVDSDIMGLDQIGRESGCLMGVTTLAHVSSVCWNIFCIEYTVLYLA